MSASVSALGFSCRQLGVSRPGRENGRTVRMPAQSPTVSSRIVLAMQKVEGSSPFIRF